MNRHDFDKKVPNHFDGYRQTRAEHPAFIPTTTAIPISGTTHPSMPNLRSRLEHLDVGQIDSVLRINELEKNMQELQKTVMQLTSLAQPTSDILELRDIPYADAKELIREYFIKHDGENIDAADLQDALGIDILMAVQICEELEKEGRITAG